MMMKFRNVYFLAILFLFACTEEPTNEIKETATSGNMKVLVDDSFADIIDEQIQVFTSDYPNANIVQIKGNEGNLMPTFLNDSTRYIILSRMLTEDEEKIYKNRKIPVNTDRIAIDGIALIAKSNSIDSNINVQELIDIMKGEGKNGKSLVFSSPYSSTLRYFKEMAGVDSLPKSNLFTLTNSTEVIDYVSKNQGYIGVVGLNWYIDQTTDGISNNPNIMLMNVKNLPGKKGDKKFYKPTQDNIISGIYPLLRNIYVINAEGRNGLGTGFATWLTSERGQLVFLKSGLGPHKLTPRTLNITNN
ncbi:substrate-binding domain-containing protein [Pedobacter flavus]|uniref:Substrate-binding domain-containing protein n=1 Tax=Pedobacter flavus TaxID=3113906 RepID=A0ABU7GZX8_9SPHI|nr:substrate-binding domain-containing protein [Pedobacter sp. VNH31]MEE1884629.1 substrate-binding domain-containing protein [Pedobacter sp. VNH31]